MSKPYTPDPNFDYDLVVIGGGSGGVRASRISAVHGAKVLLIEGQIEHGPPGYSAIGGTCVNVGCVPKKLMVFASRYPAIVEESKGYGWNEGPSSLGKFSWETFMEAKDKEISRLNKVYTEFVLKKAGVEIVEGIGKLDGKNSVEISMRTGGTKKVSAKNILICVGGWPFKPNIPGIEHTITSNEIFYLKQQPKRIVIVGGGFVACEFAQIMNGLGTKVTLLYRKDLFLRGFDNDFRQHIYEEMSRTTDIDIRFNTNATEVIKNVDGSFTVVCGENNDSVSCDQVMYATGRVGKSGNIGLETVPELNTKGSFIPVDDYSRTNVPGIYAVGDVTNRMALTPVALMEGHCLADTVFGGIDRPVDHVNVASTVFTTPELGTVGYTEEAAADKFKNISVFKTRFKPMAHSFPKTEAYTLMKIIVDTATDKVIGCHISTDGAGEMIQGVAIAVKMGATKKDFDCTIGIHPTSAEELVTMRTPSYKYVDGKKVEE